MITLIYKLEIEAPIEKCFDLMRSVDVHLASARSVRARATAGRQGGLSQSGDQTEWSAVFFGVRFHLLTQITKYCRPICFSDEMVSGLFASFSHHYAFSPIGKNRTMVSDEFFFESPYPLAVAFVDRYLLKPRMVQLLEVRCRAVRDLAESQDCEAYLT